MVAAVAALMAFCTVEGKDKVVWVSVCCVCCSWLSGDAEDGALNRAQHECLHSPARHLGYVCLHSALELTAAFRD